LYQSINKKTNKSKPKTIKNYKTKKKEAAKKIKLDTPWQKVIDNVNRCRNNKEVPNSQYKINIRNASAWHVNRENSIYLTKKIGNILNNPNQKIMRRASIN